MKFCKILLLLFLAVVATACSDARYSTKKGNYLKQSKVLPPIVVPAGAAAPEQKPYYSVPTKAVSVTKEQVPSLKPPTLQ